MRTTRGYASVVPMPALSRRAAVLAAAATAAFVGFAVAVADGTFDHLDTTTYRSAHRHAVHSLLTACRWFTDVFSPVVDVIVLLVAAAALANRRRDPRPLVAALSGVALLVVTVLGVKHGMGRPPPTLTPDRPPRSVLSFPSGHTASALVCYGLLAQLVSRRGTSRRRCLLLAVAALTACVAAALVYAGYHWVTDTVGAMLLGMAILATLRATQWTKGVTTGTSFAETLNP
jgi:membrane-associated phospholipid phosphatase